MEHRMQLKKEQAERLLEEIGKEKSSAVLVTELIANYHRMCPEELYEALVEIRTSIECEEWAHNCYVEDLKKKLVELDQIVMKKEQ